MNIDIQTAKVLLNKINEIIIKDNDWYWFSKSCHFKLIDVSYGGTDRKNLSLKIQDNKVKFRIEHKTFEYFIPFKSQNWFEKLFFNKNIDYNDPIYKEANSIIDSVFKESEEKQKNKDLKFLNEFLEK